jgi:hypothetical protein
MLNPFLFLGNAIITLSIDQKLVRRLVYDMFLPLIVDFFICRAMKVAEKKASVESLRPLLHEKFVIAML